MKFTEEQAREALRAELTNKGRKTLHMSERTLARQTALLMKKLATEETGLPDFVADVIEILEDIEGGARKKDADFAKYKEEHPETEPPKQEPKPNDPPKGDPELEVLKAKIEALEKENAESKRLSKLSAKKTELAAALASKGVNDKEWIDSLLSKVNMKDDLDVDAEADDYAKLYNKSRANVPPTPTPGTPAGGSTSPFLQSIQASAKLAKTERSIIETNNDKD